MSLYSINEVTLFGNIGKIQEFKTQSGAVVCKISLATSENTKKNGEWVEETEWHNIVVFGRTAELCIKNLVKGSKLIVKGRLKTRSYQDKNRETKYTTEIIAESIKFVDSKKASSQQNEDKIYEKEKLFDEEGLDDFPF